MNFSPLLVAKRKIHMHQFPNFGYPYDLFKRTQICWLALVVLDSHSRSWKIPHGC
jgi:hypothetical protein